MQAILRAFTESLCTLCSLLGKYSKPGREMNDLHTGSLSYGYVLILLILIAISRWLRVLAGDTRKLGVDIEDANPKCGELRVTAKTHIGLIKYCNSTKRFKPCEVQQLCRKAEISRSLMNDTLLSRVHGVTLFSFSHYSPVHISLLQYI